MDENTEFYIIDFDRTLADSDKLIEVFIEIADKYFHISSDQIRKVDAEVKQRGDTFLLATYVRDHLSSENRLDDWQGMEKMFIHESRALNYQLDGANELLEWMDENNKRYGILTYGDSLWQRLKLTAAGFNHVHHIIMDHKEKGRFISGWRQQDGTFNIPKELGGGVAERVIMIDDKAVSFLDYPDRPSHGYWVLDSGHELLSQKGTVPDNVTRYSNLNEVVQKLNEDVDKP